MISSILLSDHLQKVFICLLGIKLPISGKPHLHISKCHSSQDICKPQTIPCPYGFELLGKEKIDLFGRVLLGDIEFGKKEGIGCKSILEDSLFSAKDLKFCLDKKTDAFMGIWGREEYRSERAVKELDLVLYIGVKKLLLGAKKCIERSYTHIARRGDIHHFEPVKTLLFDELADPLQDQLSFKAPCPLFDNIPFFAIIIKQRCLKQLNQRAEMKKRVGSAIIIVALLVCSYLLYEFLSFRIHYAVSDAAFVRSDTLTTLTFKVPGKIVEMKKKEGEPVKKGEILARLDASDYLLQKEATARQIEAAKKRLAALQAKKARVERELAIDTDVRQREYEAAAKKAAALRKKLEVLESRYQKVAKDAARFYDLWRKNLVAKAKYEAYATQKAALKAEMASLNEQIAAAEAVAKKAALGVEAAKTKQRLVDELTLQIEGVKDELAGLGKSLELLDKKIAYCRLKAPYDGAVAKRFVNIARVVDAGSPIYAVVDPRRLHVEVLLSEKKLAGVEPGNGVKIWVDAFKDREYRGEVERILPASAATFALVPRDASSGEFTKLDQRFVVRIRLLDPTPDLRVGMGASVAIRRSGK
jgi:membrane fusion protein (multidrug efflux system)